MHCRTTQNYAGGHSGWAAGAGGTFRRWMASGEIGGVRYYYHPTEASSPGAHIGTSVTLQDGIRSDCKSLRRTSPMKMLTA